MIWLRIYPTYEVLGFLFDLDKSNIGRNLQGVLTVLQQELGDEIQWPDKRQRKRKLAAFMQDFPEGVAIVDATEQPTQRPKDAEAQKRYYSGKKKRHTLKTQIVVAPDGELMAVSQTVPGSRHDKKLDEALITKYPLRGAEYIEVADHLVASQSFDVPGEVWMWALKNDLEYEEAKKAVASKE